jgi:uncharacterized repeat protein (TIGR03943 family)
VRRVGPALLLVTGFVVARLYVSGGYLDYVKPAQGPFLLAAGVVLVVLGLVGLFARGSAEEERRPVARIHTHGPLAAPPEVVREANRAERDARRHDHRLTPAIAVLLLLPVITALGVSPPPLGAFTAARSGAAVPSPVARRDYPPLPPGPVELQVHDYAERAAWDAGRTLGHHTVTLTGFATPDGDKGWYLTRIVITCCAADARSYLVGIDGSARPPVANSWQRVTGTWVASPPAPDGGPTARLALTSVTAVPAPAETYELP